MVLHSFSNRSDPGTVSAKNQPRVARNRGPGVLRVADGGLKLNIDRARIVTVVAGPVSKLVGGTNSYMAELY